MVGPRSMGDTTFIPGDDIDEIAAQYVQLRQSLKIRNATVKHSRTTSAMLQLMARLVNRYGLKEAHNRIRLAQESWDLLTPKEETSVQGLKATFIAFDEASKLA